MLNLAVQSRNRDFFKAGEFSWNYDTLDKHSPTTRGKQTPQRKDLHIFCLESLKNFNLNEKFLDDHN